MLEITLYGKNSNEVIEIVRELRCMGWVQGKDFDFSYIISTLENWNEVLPKHTVFTFYTEKYASYFALKYAS